MDEVSDVDATEDVEPAGEGSGRRYRRVGVATAVALVLAAGASGVGIGRWASGGTATTQPAASGSVAAPGQVPLANGAGYTPVTAGSGTTGVTGTTTTVAEAVDAGLVDIDTVLGYESAAAAGTGMVLTSSGEVLTNNHVIEGATSITATDVATGRTYTAKVVGTDPTADVAVLQLQGASGLGTVTIGDSSKVAVGEAVIAIGNAGGSGGAPSVVTGSVDALGQSITASDGNGANAETLSDLLETDAPIEAGDSGGPLVNATGEVIGMDTAASARNQLQSAQSVAYAIPIDDAITLATQIEAGQPSSTVHIGETGFLGVEAAPSPVTGAAGAAVAAVVSESPAATAGLAAGDVITSVDGVSVESASGLTTVMQSHHPGDKIAVAWTDHTGAEHSATVTLVAGPAA